MDRGPATVRHTAGLQAQAQTQGLIDVEPDRMRDDSQPVTHPLHGDRAVLRSLCLGVAIEPRLRGWKKDLERVDAFDLDVTASSASPCCSPTNIRQVVNRRAALALPFPVALCSCAGVLTPGSSPGTHVYVRLPTA